MAFFGNQKRDNVYDSPQKKDGAQKKKDAGAEALKMSGDGFGKAAGATIEAEAREVETVTPVVEGKVVTPAAEKGANTFISKDVTASGAINSSTDIIIEGKFEGPIHTAGKVFVRNGGEVKGDITANGIVVESGEIVGDGDAKDVVLNGKMTGNIVADMVTVQGDACLNGDVVTKGLVIATGAQVNGQFSVNTTAIK